ncbi:Hypothetical protein ORPV_603 [Orpheovirus IHUMI-LCC2]|uniref:Uncharacterized protein n=1 Tax=Orpheovirus IHUMI-LCC2 TaxID=2023057 RepID=A0A2I2L4Q5_9VIRU|nr:Hypothetical protein ORPV_603 [Orpheovirus IHUMI-LCC2]SNW62507.1 Hypothetical protein ORPV_603 [Orpheovirus IHUMI-LCC2]
MYANNLLNNLSNQNDNQKDAYLNSIKNVDILDLTSLQLIDILNSYNRDLKRSFAFIKLVNYVIDDLPFMDIINCFKTSSAKLDIMHELLELDANRYTLSEMVGVMNEICDSDEDKLQFLEMAIGGCTGNIRSGQLLGIMLGLDNSTSDEIKYKILEMMYERTNISPGEITLDNYFKSNQFIIKANNLLGNPSHITGISMIVGPNGTQYINHYNPEAFKNNVMKNNNVSLYSFTTVSRK